MENLNTKIEEIIILGIETSCDETSVAVVKNGKYLLSNIIASQMKFHQKYGGVVPEIASRKHMEFIMITCKEALNKAGLKINDIDAIAVVPGPGLKGSLLVGLSFAKAIAFALKKPLIGVNHIEGHIYANFLNQHNIKAPFISLIVSGGHTSLILVNRVGEYEVIGRTRDDAAGEVFDKIAKYLGYHYPGGPIIEKLAETGKSDAIDFPRPLLNSKDFDFSFSGLKTSVIYFIMKERDNGNQVHINDVCASFQKAIIDILKYKTFAAARYYNISTILLGGGVAANEKLRREFIENKPNENYKICYPPKELCTDNAAMVASAGYFKMKQGITDSYNLEVFTK